MLVCLGLGYWMGLSVHQAWVALSFCNPSEYYALSAFTRSTVEAEPDTDEPLRKKQAQESGGDTPSTAEAKQASTQFQLDRQNLLDYYYYYNPAMVKMVDMVLGQGSPHMHLAQMMQEK